MSNPNLNAVEIVKETFNRLGDVYSSLLIIGLPYLVFTLIVSFFQVSYPNSLILLLLTLISSIVGLWYSAAGWIYCHKVLNGQNMTVERAFKVSLPKIVNLFLAVIMVSLIFFVGFLLLIIPGIYLSIRLSFTFYEIAVENCSAIEGIKRSWELTKGHWWFIFGTSLLIGLVIMIPVLIVSIVVGIALGITLGDIEILETVGNLLGSVIGYLFVPIYFIATTIMYDRLIASYKLVN